MYRPAVEDPRFGTDERPEAMREAAQHFFRQHFPQQKFMKLYKHLGPITATHFDEAVTRYQYLRGARELLRSIAAMYGIRSGRPFGESIAVPVDALENILVLSVDNEGALRAKHQELFRTLEGVEARRIRQCSECKRIFWAGRTDKFACTRQCVVGRRVRRWRERYPEHYKLQRYKKAETDTVQSTGRKRRKP